MACAMPDAYIERYRIGDRNFWSATSSTDLKDFDVKVNFYKSEHKSHVISYCEFNFICREKTWMSCNLISLYSKKDKFCKVWSFSERQ